MKKFRLHWPAISSEETVDCNTIFEWCGANRNRTSQETPDYSLHKAVPPHGLRHKQQVAHENTRLVSTVFTQIRTQISLNPHHMPINYIKYAAVLQEEKKTRRNV
jgi:hypothetical protein